MRDTLHYVYAKGLASHSSSLSNAKGQAATMAKEGLVSTIESEIQSALMKQGLTTDEAKAAVKEIIDEHHKSEIIEFADQLDARPGKTDSGYTYYTVARIPRPVVREIIGQSIMKSDTLNSVENLSLKAILMSISKEDNR